MTSFAGDNIKEYKENMNEIIDDTKQIQDLSASMLEISMESKKQYVSNEKKKMVMWSFNDSSGTWCCYRDLCRRLL